MFFFSFRESRWLGKVGLERDFLGFGGWVGVQRIDKTDLGVLDNVFLMFFDVI